MESPPKQYPSFKSSGSSRTTKKRQRVILLCDLDCFYAQCECIRLGIDCSTVPVALLQWNSALAVNYPARDLQIRRGDSYETIRTKSNGKCIALHLPVIPVSTNHANKGRLDDDAQKEEEKEGGEDDINAAYEKEYRLSPDMQRQLLEKEKNKMRRPSEGKASLERYRIASSRIFNVILKALSDHIGKNNFVLERASIDELFVDITDHCYDEDRPAWLTCPSEADQCHGKIDAHTIKRKKSAEQHLAQTYADHIEEEDNGIESFVTKECGSMENLPPSSWKKDTVVCCKEEFTHQALPLHQVNGDNEVIHALQRGCIVAKRIRESVADLLGFTLSVGISTSKLVAKLAASHGKPNGQAVIFPWAIGKIMEETKIKKVRHFGGKVGKKIQALLPPGEETMGSIARFLSLSDLSMALGNETGQMVFNACRGDDDEEVKETEGALTKSITAFKSFRPLSFPVLEQWVELLATDVISRVELDTKRNERHPKNCNIQYVYLDEYDSRVTRSIRIPFPTKPPRIKSTSSQTKLQLVDRVRVALNAKAHFPICRLGLSAVDFETKPKCCIDSFFTPSPGLSSWQEENSTSKVAPVSSPAKAPYDVHIKANSKKLVDEDQSTQHRKENLTSLNQHTTSDVKGGSQFSSLPRSSSPAHYPSSSKCSGNNSDLLYAQKLQAMYDRENTLFSTLEKDRHSKKATNKQRGSAIDSTALAPAAYQTKRRKIDSFFTRKDKPR